MLTLTNLQNNKSFKVLLVKAGDKYGLNDCLIADNDMIEFYDGNQFVSRYLIETILNISDDGLSLYGGVSSWYITKENVNTLQDYLHNIQ